MTNRRTAFLQAILDASDDDTPRLILADWLDDHGESERAEFIRVQCAIDKHPGLNCGQMYCSERDPGGLCDRCLEFKRLCRRERDLLRSNFGAWTDSLPEEIVTMECPSCIDQPADWETNVVECRRCESTGRIANNDGVEFRRGFVEHATCTWADFARHADAIRDATPLREVTLTTLPSNERWQFDSSGIMVRLDGRKWHYESEIAAIGRKKYPGMETANVIELLLIAEFGDGITFHLPK